MKTHSEKNNFLDKIKNNKKIQYITVIVLSLIITLIFLFSYLNESGKSEVSDGVEGYVTRLETRLSEVLAKVKGVGKTAVIIKVDGGMETVIAKKTVITEVGGKTETEESPVLVNGKTVILKELYPEISGVIIVAEGAENITVMRRIQDAVLSLFDLDLNKIEILAMK